MVVASGQYPYQYDVPLPVSGPIGQSGNILEAGMFVANAELRKWGREPNDVGLIYNLYRHPDISASGFEPKGNGSTLGGDVAGPALIVIDNLLELRTALRTSFQGLWNLYGDDTGSDSSRSRQYIAESYFTTGYPGIHPSGFIRTIDTGVSISIQGGLFLRPELDDVTGADDHLDTDLHWLGGSGILFDVDVGEVIFQPFAFHSAQQFFGPGFDNQRFVFGPYYPSFQKTDGSIISLTTREFQTAGAGSWRLHTNFDAISSGKVQLDGYAVLPDTQLRFIADNRNASNYFDQLSATSDLTFFSSGQRQVNFPDGQNDGTARTYWTPQAQSSGVYSVLPYTPKSAQPLLAIESGIFGIFPAIDYRVGLTNRNLNQCITVSSDDKVIKLNNNGATTQGYQVFDDSIWITTPGKPELSGTPNFPTKGVYPISPFTGTPMWFRDAEKTIASTGNKPTLSSQYDSGVPTGTPGNFEVHSGLEPIGTADILRISRVWEETVTPGSPNDTYDNTVYFQRYSAPTMSHSETSVSWSFTGSSPGIVDNAISDLFFDGSDYWVVGKLVGRCVRFTGALVFNGHYDGPIMPRAAYINNEYIYWVNFDSGIEAGDPLTNDPNMTNYSIASGIGKWSFTAPADINTDIGTITHDSAKPIVAETTVGFAFGAGTRIHDVIEIEAVDAIHVTPGIWVLIQFDMGADAELWLLRVTEQSTFYQVEEAINLDLDVDDGGSEYPFDIIWREID